MTTNYKTMGPIGCLAMSLFAMPAANGQATPGDDGSALQEIVVTGVRASEQRSVDLKRGAVMIQDSISAEDIGKLPDTTISDSLQRITGVQIDRDGGEGTSVNIRGLPQVGTLLNGESFLTTQTIVGVQPDFGDVPSQLFAGADVMKSSTASLLNGGITGTIDLRTRRPFDLKSGWTLSGAAEGAHGKLSDKYQPLLDGLIGYHAEKWGLLASVAYSDVTLENSQDGMDQYSGALYGETTDSTTSSIGFLNSYLGAPLPSGMRLLTPGNCTNNGGTYTATTTNGCDVDVNGDGKATGAFYGSPDFAALDRQLERKRIGFNLSAQADMGGGFSASGDFFYTDQQRHDRTTGYQLNNATFSGATFLPVTARDTGTQVFNGFNGGDTSLNEFYTTQRYQDYLGDIETYSENHQTDSISRNFNLQLHYDNGGNFTADVRGIAANAHELHLESYTQFALSDGGLWPNEPDGVAPYGSMVYPGGNRVFDPPALGVFPANTVPALVDMTGSHMAITLPGSLQSLLNNKDAYSLKTIASENDYERSATMRILRADGHYKLAGSKMGLDFGVRHGSRTASNENFALVAPVYGGNGAYNNPVDPATGLEDTSVNIANSTGCYTRYKAVDVILDGGGIPGGCKAGDPNTGFYRAGVISAQPPGQLPPVLANNISFYKSLAGVNGVGIYDLNPKVMDDVLAFQNSLYPGEVRSIDPGGTWRVHVAQTSGYVQGNFSGDALVHFSGNVGVRFIRTSLGIDQHQVGEQPAYFVNPTDLGIIHTDHDFTDILPAFNLALDLRDDLKLRFAYAKNMQLLDLDQWGGGLTLQYGIVAGSSPPVFAVLNGAQAGNPELKPWRSSNYDLSLEYYTGRSSVLSLAVFFVDVASFISNGSALRCDLPDEDGIVRNRCVAISGPIQGTGKSLHGVEAGAKQAFDFLPGVLGNFGVDVNFTFSPSNVGTDVAGNTIPFQDNSKEQGNAILWYQDKRFEVRLAGNYRSKRAFSQDYGGIAGFEEYQAPTFYLDASASFDISKHVQLYVQGTNLTQETERYYLVWPDQVMHTGIFESRYTVGIRGRL
ncbi:MAG: TonB-dependent receptor [Gammaproteobacteria bacterium]